MSMKGKGNLWTGLIVVHFVKMIVLFILSVDYQNESGYQRLQITTWYSVFFMVDILILFMIWFMKPSFEEGARTVGFFWSIMPIFALFGWIDGIYVMLCIIESVIFAWPKHYGLPDDDISQVRAIPDSLRIKCTHCNAVYSYNREAVEEGKVLCQNCGGALKN